MNRAPRTKNSVEKDFRFWPFYEMFMNHIENMGWITSLVITESSTDYKIAKGFEEVRLETVETYYQALETSTLTNDNIKKLKFGGLYIGLFNSSDKSSQYFPAEEIDNHHRSGPLSWRLLTI